MKVCRDYKDSSFPFCGTLGVISTPVKALPKSKKTNKVVRVFPAVI